MIPQRERTRSTAGIELVRRLAAEGDRIFTTRRARELGPEVGLKDAYLGEALHRLSRGGWIVRLRRGLYAISSSMPGVSPVHEFEVAMALVRPAAISHWSALHHHGLTDQAPRRVFVLTTTEANAPRGVTLESSTDGVAVAGTEFRFVQVQPERYFGVENVWIGEARICITDPERTLLDGLARPRLCGDFAEVLHGFEVGAADLDLERIVDYAFRLDAANVKRLGWVLEHIGVEPSTLERLLAAPVKGYRTLDPSGPRRGPRNRRWMIQENLPGKMAR